MSSNAFLKKIKTKKLILVFFLVFFSFFITKSVLAKNTEILLFYEPSCPACQKTLSFLGELKKDYSNIEIKLLNPFSSSKEKNIYLSLKKAYHIKSNEISVPFIFIDDQVFDGYNTAIANKIKQTVVRCHSLGCSSPLDKLSQETDSSQKKNSFSFFIFILVGITLFLFLIKKFKKK